MQEEEAEAGGRITATSQESQSCWKRQKGFSPPGSTRASAFSSPWFWT